MSPYIEALNDQADMGEAIQIIRGTISSIRHEKQPPGLSSQWLFFAWISMAPLAKARSSGKG